MSEVLCDKCGEPLLPSELRYTGADKFDEEERWISGRHAGCHADRAEQHRDLVAQSKRAQAELLDAAARLSRTIRRIR